MSNALDALKEGNFDAALSHAKMAVRDDPGDPEARAQLFQIFCLNGEWDRANAQLEALLTASQAQAPIWKQFQILTKLEAQRQEAHASATAPAIVGDPEDWMAGFAKAFELHMSGDVEAGAKLREESLGDASAVAGQVDHQEFEWLMDGDARYGPMLEAFLPTEGDYCWVPVHGAHLAQDREADPGQSLYLGAGALHLEGRSGYCTAMFQSAMSARRIRKTVSTRSHAEPHGSTRGLTCFVGLGQRVLMSADEDFPILDLQRGAFPAVKTDRTWPRTKATEQLRAPLMYAFRSAAAAGDAKQRLDIRTSEGERVIASRRATATRRRSLSDTELKRADELGSRGAAEHHQSWNPRIPN